HALPRAGQPRRRRRHDFQGAVMGERQQGLEALLRQAPVVPVLVIDDVTDAVPLAKALVAGGLPVLEITLRTEAAPYCIRAIKAEVEGAIVGSGTVLDKEGLRLSAEL